MDVNGKVAIVTGGGSGLGLATCQALAAKGATVVVVDLNGEKADAVARPLGGIGIGCDVSNEADVKRVVDQARETLGPARILVNCAGISESALVVNRKGVPNPLENFKKLMAIHVQGTYDMIRLVVADMLSLPTLDDDERGVIVNTSSIAAFEGQIGAVTYAAAKAAIAGMTLPMAREFASYGIRVNAIAPGLFMTGMADQINAELLDTMIARAPFPKRFGRPDEFARVVIEMCENVMFNGDTIRFDGAYRMQYK